MGKEIKWKNDFCDNCKVENYIFIMVQIKVALVGDEAVGKTTFITRLITGEFIKEHHHTNSPKKYLLKWNTNYGRITFIVVEATESADDIDAYLVMFDLTRKETYESVSNYIETAKNKRDNIPIVVCGNKCDGHEVYHGHINTTIQNIDISSKSNYNFDKPLLTLASIVLSKPDLHLVEEKPVPPPKVSLSPQDQQCYNDLYNDMHRANSVFNTMIEGFHDILFS